MKKEEIERINFLHKKYKEHSLTHEETLEREELRTKYRNEYKAQFQNVLNNTYVLEKDGTKRKLIKND
jgi:uncharacterized protein YnzC (UPF0291/DUF896 family)